MDLGPLGRRCQDKRNLKLPMIYSHPNLFSVTCPSDVAILDLSDSLAMAELLKVEVLEKHVLGIHNLTGKS